jgi:hypothetical protein
VLNGTWDVSHDDPLASDNNCVQASMAAGLYTGDRNQDLDSCLDDIRIWIRRVRQLRQGTSWQRSVHAGRPADQAGRSLYPNLDAAAQADNWGTYGSLTGKVLVEIIPGTFEQAVDPSST